MIQLLHNLRGQVGVLIREPWAVAGMMKRGTARRRGSPPAAFITLPGCGTLRAGTSPSLPQCQRGPPAFARQQVWREGRQRSAQEPGKMRRKDKGDGAVGDGVEGTAVLASGLAESTSVNSVCTEEV